MSQFSTKIVLIHLRTNLFHIVLFFSWLILGTSVSWAQQVTPNKETNPVETASPLNLQVADSTIVDTTKVDVKKALLEGKIKTLADDYRELNQEEKTLTLYNNAQIQYLDIDLKGGIVILNYEKDEVYAGRIKDSLGNYTQTPVFKQGSNVVEPDSIRFNFKTGKALIWNSRSDQGEFKVLGEITKRENDSVFFVKNARFTTSKNVEKPEYYFLARKIKLVPKKKVVTGFTNMYIADVPTPIGLPFAFFPMSETSQSGIIIPNYQDTRNQGYALQNGGYYLALSDYYDLTVLGDYYTNGSYGMRFESNYGVRYKFRGNVNLRFENLIQSERGFPDYSKQNIYNIQWSHSQDAKANPNSRFSANVNLGSTTFFQQSLNNVNVGSALNNTLASSISYSKTINSTPGINLSATINHNQNTQTGIIGMTLPTFQGSVDRIFPFAGGDGAKKGLIKNINLQYNLRAENRIQTTDSLFFKPEMFRDARTGFQHSIPLSTNFKVFRYFSVTASTNYNEVWYLKTIDKTYDSNLGKEIITDVNGFDAFRTYNFTSSVGTTIYGTFNFGEKKKIQTIRHVMRPSVSYNHTPSFEQYFDTYVNPSTGKQVDFSRFDQGIFGAPGKTVSNNMGFSLSNTFEAKITEKDSTKTEPKKMMLLNNFNFSTSYDMTADSLKWTPVRVTGGTAFFDNKMNLNFGTTLDPYANNGNGRINKLNIDNGGSLFRMTSANFTINYAVSSRGKDDKPRNEQGQRNGGRDDDLFGGNTDMSDRRKSQFDEVDERESENAITKFFNAKLPFDLTFAYSLTYGNNNREKKITGNSIMASGNFDLSPRWKGGVSTGYDFVQKGVTFTQFRFERDLLSWRMDFNWAPYGRNASWGFFIGIKSSVLSDIKYDKRALPDRQLR
ncbi:MAG: putative LPS assembly protein LptD [Flavobacterium sp.]